MNYAKKAVQDGAKVLDDHFGGNSWQQKIDVDKLDMSNATRCILGQVFGNYYDGLRNIGLTLEDRKYGFSDWPVKGVDYPDMAEAWKSYLNGEFLSGKMVLLMDEGYGGVVYQSKNPVEVKAAKDALNSVGVNVVEFVEV